MQNIDMVLDKKFAPKRFDKFDFIPSAGASGGGDPSSLEQCNAHRHYH